jgi:purine nucleoside permease
MHNRTASTASYADHITQQGRAPNTPQTLGSIRYSYKRETAYADTDQAGELEAWSDSYPSSEHIPCPQGHYELRYSAADQVLGIVTGECTAHAAASITVLGHDQ